MNEKDEDIVIRLHREAVEQMRRDGTAPGPAETPGISYTELPQANPDSSLYVEWNLYRREVGRLLAEGNADRHVLIKGEQIIGVWNTHDEAMEAAYRQFLGQAFLVHQIQERERVLLCATVTQWPNLSSRSRLAS